MSYTRVADDYLDRCNRLYHESLKYVDVGFLPFLAVSRLTHHSPLVQICDRFPGLLIYPVNFILSLFSFILFIFYLPLISAFISLIRILRPIYLFKTIPYLFEPQLIVSNKLFFIEPFVYQNLSNPTYFKFIFSQIKSRSKGRTHHFLLLDSPFKLLSLYSYTLADSSSLIPCFGGILQNAMVLLSQTLFLLKFTVHLFRFQRDLILTWLSIFPRIYTSWSFSLVFLKNFLLHFADNKSSQSHAYVLYEGLLRDIVFSRFLPAHTTTFYSHIPFFSKSAVFFTNLRYIKSSSFIFEDPNAISILTSQGILSHKETFGLAPPPLNSHFSSHLFTQFSNNSSVIDFHSSKSCSHKPLSFSSLDDLCESSISFGEVTILLLPQGFLPESNIMISMVDELLTKRPFLRSVLKVYISLHPTLSNNKSLIQKIQKTGISYASSIPDHLQHPLVILCGESSAFNRFSSYSIYPLAYLPSHSYSDSVFSPYIQSHMQRIINSQSLVDFMDYLFGNSSVS